MGLFEAFSIIVAMTQQINQGAKNNRSADMLLGPSIWLAESSKFLRMQHFLECALKQHAQSPNLN